MLCTTAFQVPVVLGGVRIVVDAVAAPFTTETGGVTSPDIVVGTVGLTTDGAAPPPPPPPPHAVKISEVTPNTQ
jgi:hypothetical protein